MSTYYDAPDQDKAFAWRAPAPRARQAAMALYSWQDPGWVFLIAVFAALPFMLAAAFAPALLSLTPTVEMISPIADARAVAAGEMSLNDTQSPFYLILLLAADLFVDAPGRIHLLAKAFAAALVAYPLAYYASARTPALQSVLLTAAFAAFVAAPFSAEMELGFAMFLVVAFAFICAPADEGVGRARFEGALAGLGLFMLWLLNPIFAMAGFIALCVCPFLSGPSGLQRYLTSFGAFVVLAALIEFLSPGINMARIAEISGLASGTQELAGREGAFGIGGVMASSIVVIVSAAIFGGREHARGWAGAAGLLVLGLIAARAAGANSLPLFGLAASFACFSVYSPFYDGLFRNHDRASVSAALSVAILTLFWTGAIIVHVAGQFTLQQQVAQDAPADIRAQLGLVQPGGPTIARWIEEGRFSTPEARELFALAPVDQSAMLLEAAAKARAISEAGVNVAILTGADTACVIASKRVCRADGQTAADAAVVVLVPRLDLDPATTATKEKSEAMLYTEFRLVDQGVLWDVWVRRGVDLPVAAAAALARNFKSPSIVEPVSQ